MRGHAALSPQQLAGNSCEAPENVLCPAVIVSPAIGVTGRANRNFYRLLVPAPSKYQFLHNLKVSI